MTRIALVSLIATLLSAQATAFDFDDDDNQRFGIKITEDDGRLTFKGEGFDLSDCGRFKIYTPNKRTQAEVRFRIESDSRNMRGMENKVTLLVEGRRERAYVTNHESIDLDRGKYRLAANLDEEPINIMAGEAEIEVTIEIR
ncbi:hypothetical protein [Vibrio panuliri]|uniref:Secreted protein n=1 Tax=Vibrio panuliri TaxID=1381081 RepID=A0ABX3FNS0_9VIBR|nr:hypothetical protein [Vibrio panuliri]KAB1455111.1 hypothetical protein F7O85_19915 [Vibrio panuliri]OLQ94839.1 hypothetical protein BIY20_00675 [Vibrio panuliri]